jgi:hypothetical protein
MSAPVAGHDEGGRGRRWLCGIIGLSVALRVGAALYLGNTVTPLPGTADQLSYHTLAVRVLGGHGFSFATGWWPATPANEPTAHWSFLYTLLLAGIYAAAGPTPFVARLVQAFIVGVLQPLLVYRVGSRVLGERIGLVSAAIVAGYAYFVYYAAALMTESLFIVAFLWSVDRALRLADNSRRLPGRGEVGLWLQLGTALATAVLLRQAVLIVVPVILAWVAYRVRRSRVCEAGPLKRSVGTVKGMGMAVGIIAVGILPWTIRNYVVFGEFVPLNTNAGFAFYWGNHPIHGKKFIPILPGDGSLYGRLIPDELKHLNEAQLDKALLTRAVAFIAANPGRYLLLSASRVVEYVKFWPSGDAGLLSNGARVLSFGICFPFILWGMAIAGLRTGQSEPHDDGARQSRADTFLLLGLAFMYSAIHCLSWTLVRYRLPVDALTIPFGALAVVRLYEGIVCKRPTGLRAPDTGVDRKPVLAGGGTDDQ